MMQVHYNMLVQRDVLDWTTVDLYYADSPVDKPAHILPLANNTFAIPPGATQTVTAEVPVFGLWELWGVVPHMHLHGTEIKVSVVHADGSSTCAVDIPRPGIPRAAVLLLRRFRWRRAGSATSSVWSARSTTRREPGRSTWGDVDPPTRCA